MPLALPSGAGEALISVLPAAPPPAPGSWGGAEALPLPGSPIPSLPSGPG